MNEHPPRVPNCWPIEARQELPPHRRCVCPNTHVIGMSHQSILMEIASILDGEHHPTAVFWFPDLINELMYRGVIVGDQPYAYPHPRYIPNSRTEWHEMYDMREGFMIPEAGTEIIH